MCIRDRACPQARQAQEGLDHGGHLVLRAAGGVLARSRLRGGVERTPVWRGVVSPGTKTIPSKLSGRRRHS
eukprot:5590933-Alexandrium_andersonii.AAC.1